MRFEQAPTVLPAGGPRVLVEEAPGILLYPALNCVATILTTHSNVYVWYPLVLVSPQYERVEVE